MEERFDTAPVSRWQTLFWMIAAVLAGVFLLFVMLRGIRPPGLTEGTEHPAIGRKLTQLELEPLFAAEQSVTLEDLRGDVVLMNYWGVWCPPCRIELPHLVELYGRYQDHRGFRFLSVSCGPPGSLEEDRQELKQSTIQFMRDTGYQFPVYADPGGESRLALLESARLNQFAFPTTVLLDGQGTIRGLWTGYADGFVDQMEQAVEELLAKQAA